MADLDTVSLRIVETFDEAQEFLNWLGERRPIMAIDTETSGLQWWRDKLRLVQFGDPRGGWAIPWEGWGGLVQQALGWYEGDMVFHNAKFDVHQLEVHGGMKMPWGRVHDTMVMAHILNGAEKIGLKRLAGRFIDPRAAAGEEILKDAMKRGGWTFETVPPNFEPYWAYGVLDAVYTAELYEQFAPQVQASYSDLYDMERQVTADACYMERYGLRIDVDLLHQKMREYDVVLEAYKARGKQLGFSLGSNRQVVDYLKQQGISFNKVTPTGQDSLDAEVLRQIDHPVARGVLEYRQMQKIYSTYFKNFEEMRDGDVVHCSIKTVGTRTGRMSISEPALQTLPREHADNRFAIDVRDLIIPPDDHVLVTGDFDQIEQRLVAHFAEEQGMMQAFAKGDVFTEMARQIYQDPTIQKRDERRQHTKNCAYTKAYGGGLGKFALTAGINIDQARDFLQMYDSMFPGVVRFQRLVDRVARERKQQTGEAFVVTPFGRRHVADQDKMYTLVNYLVQGTAADILKYTMVKLDHYDLGPPAMRLPVHDELLFYVHRDQIDEQYPVIQQVMQDLTTYQVPLTVGLEVVQRWGDKFRDLKQAA